MIFEEMKSNLSIPGDGSHEIERECAIRDRFQLQSHCVYSSRSHCEFRSETVNNEDQKLRRTKIRGEEGAKSGDFGDAVINRASFEQEAGIESYTTDDIGLEEESDPGESDASYNQNVDTEAVLSSDLRRRLLDRLRKRFNEED
ncbi:hypothetical protein P5673_030436 [Acropora cervicornis]|uniref:Uncharacterized protein n=1 Tax=Acropora cervicornis TaxID=6130 RepID=A0AAD9PUB3_ACRCE|nr:hypothetical protein P5673_030436 [Acropora cervicornis]